MHFSSFALCSNWFSKCGACIPEVYRIYSIAVKPRNKWVGFLPVHSLSPKHRPTNSSKYRALLTLGLCKFQKVVDRFIRKYHSI